MNAAPPVSCMCLTYGRPPRLLEEAIESFLRQDYRGEKELIILNDLPHQELRFEHPEVQIINVGKRFRTVGEKRNACAALCSHDWLLPWDDDDIFLPRRISYSMEMMDCARRFFKSVQAFLLNGTAITGVLKSIFHSGSCWHRSLFDEVQGYPHMDSGQDAAIERKFAHVLTGLNLDFDIRLEEIYYVYRWGGTDSYHLSAFAQTRKSNESEHVLVADYVSQQLESGKIPSGEIQLKPHWKADYVATVRQYLDQMPALNST